MHAKELKFKGGDQQVLAQVTEMKPVLPLVRVFPLAKNEVLVRATNLADIFDSKAAAQFLDIHAYAEELYAQANSGSKPAHIAIEEQNLQGTAKKSDSQFRWRHAGPAIVGEPQTPASELFPNAFAQAKGNESVALRPQESRSFKITFS
jgi:hypothetical protein